LAVIATLLATTSLLASLIRRVARRRSIPSRPFAQSDP
jgi:hypothetical protein